MCKFLWHHPWKCSVVTHVHAHKHVQNYTCKFLWHAPYATIRIFSVAYLNQWIICSKLLVLFSKFWYIRSKWEIGNTFLYRLLSLFFSSIWETLALHTLLMLVILMQATHGWSCLLSLVESTKYVSEPNSSIIVAAFFFYKKRHFQFCKPFSTMCFSPQLRVHCAEVLGTPIVGDYKYGWQAHRRLQNLPESELRKNSNEKFSKENMLPFGLNMDRGSILEKSLGLHLHCREMIIPDVAQALQNLQLSSDHDLSKLKSLEIVAPLPSYMQRSWDILNPWPTTGILQASKFAINY